MYLQSTTIEKTPQGFECKPVYIIDNIEETTFNETSITLKMGLNKYKDIQAYRDQLGIIGRISAEVTFSLAVMADAYVQLSESLEGVVLVND